MYGVSLYIFGGTPALISSTELLVENSCTHTFMYECMYAEQTLGVLELIAQATGEAALITFVPLALLKGGPREFGTEQTLFMFGATTFTLVVLLANSKVCSRRDVRQRAKAGGQGKRGFVVHSLRVTNGLIWQFFSLL